MTTSAAPAPRECDNRYCRIVAPVAVAPGSSSAVRAAYCAGCARYVCSRCALGPIHAATCPYCGDALRADAEAEP